jgi:hypothetical protein
MLSDTTRSVQENAGSLNCSLTKSKLRKSWQKINEKAGLVEAEAEV